jgi:hypothetical protein
VCRPAGKKGGDILGRVARAVRRVGVGFMRHWP